MKKAVLLVLSSFLFSCSITGVGEAAAQAEEVLCPLTTVQNVERVLVTAIRNLPFFNQWEEVCQQQ